MSAEKARFKVRRVAPVFAVVEDGNPPKEHGRYFDQKSAAEDAAVRNLVYRVYDELKAKEKGK